MLERLAYRMMAAFHRRRFPLAEPGIQKCGNYYMHAGHLRQDDVVYSCGVGDDVTFDDALHGLCGCDVHLFDPTPVAVAYMEQEAPKPHFHFHPWGVWTEDGMKPFYFKKEKLREQRSLSVTNLMHSTGFVMLECLTLPSIMRQLGHERLNILKMDIEGAALPVLRDMLATKLRPRQIVAEFEKGRSPLVQFTLETERVLRQLRASGYNLHYIPRLNGEKYNLQFLAVQERY